MLARQDAEVVEWCVCLGWIQQQGLQLADAVRPVCGNFLKLALFDPQRTKETPRKFCGVQRRI